METSSLSLENESQPSTLLDEQCRSTLFVRKGIRRCWSERKRWTLLRTNTVNSHLICVSATVAFTEWALSPSFWIRVRPRTISMLSQIPTCLWRTKTRFRRLPSEISNTLNLIHFPIKLFPKFCGIAERFDWNRKCVECENEILWRHLGTLSTRIWILKHQLHTQNTPLALTQSDSRHIIIILHLNACI